MPQVLEIEDEGHLRVMRLNRPERKNALNGPLFGALARAMHEAARDPEVWAVVLTGNGDAFCSGLDLSPDASSAPDDGGASAADESASDGGGPEVIAAIMRVECEKPIVAGINGPAVGFGLALAMAADIRIMAPSATLHPGYARVGTSPDGGASWTITQAIGYERAMRFLLEGRKVSADEAHSIGLVSEVTASDGDLGPRLLEYGRQLAAVAPIAAQQTKRLLNRITQPPDLDAHLREEVRLALHGLSSEDGRRALRALATGAQPEFEGR